MNQQPNQAKSSQTKHDVATCPACGLVCDDVLPKKLNCSKGITFFQQAIGDTQAKIKGKIVSLTEAIEAATNILMQAKQPLFSGLSTDIEGFRAVYHLAEKVNGSLTHINSASIARNMRVLQSSGWQTTTLTEVKNRADLIVCVGTDIVSHNPRFFERFVWVKEAMFIDANAREIVYLGGENLNIQEKTPASKAALVLPCRAEHLPEVLAVLHALVLGKSLRINEVAGIRIANLQTLANKLKQAKYAVLAWVAKDLDFPHAELAIQQITQTVAVLNQTTRAAGLPLGGSDGDTSVNYTHTWLSGLALSDKQNEAEQHDVEVWINSFNAEKLPQKSDTPLIVLGNANSQFKHEPDVFIPVATPGLDCSGTLFRVDGLVALPLKKIRENKLPTLSEIVHQIEAKLT